MADLAVHHSICDLAHLGENGKGFWEAILGSRFGLIAAELTLQRGKEAQGVSHGSKMLLSRAGSQCQHRRAIHRVQMA